MARLRRVVILGGAAVAAAATVTIARHLRGAAQARRAPEGILIGDPGLYDALSHRLLLGPLFRGIAADIAAAAPHGARVLEVGCGPGRLSIRLARQYGLDVTGLDLDPVMIERARANAHQAWDGTERPPSFLVGDVAALGFPDESFDLVVSTLSMHHWADPRSAMAEIGRVLRPGARALIWDLRPGLIPFHAHVRDPLEHTHGSPLRVVSATSWRWPWRLPLTRRIELVHADGPGALGNHRPHRARSRKQT